jgi:hypothetical protein
MSKQWNRRVLEVAALTIVAAFGYDVSRQPTAADFDSERRRTSTCT